MLGVPALISLRALAAAVIGAMWIVAVAGCAPESSPSGSPGAGPRAIPTLVAPGAAATGTFRPGGSAAATAAEPMRTPLPLVGTPIANASVNPGIAPGEPGSLEQPVSLGESFEVTRGDRVLRFRLEEVHWVAGPEARAISPRNPDPPEGGQYMLLKLSATYVAGSDQAAYTTDGEYRLVAGDQLWDGPTESEAPDPAFAGRTIGPGETAVGWLPPRIGPADKLQDGLMLYQGVFFSFKFRGQ